DPWFTIACATSGTHAASWSGGPTTFTIDPAVEFALNETCTVTIARTQVTDVDTVDPPDTMDADYVWTFSTPAPPAAIHDVQGAAHTSPLLGRTVSGVAGIVTARVSNGFWFQDPNADANDATSEGLFVF